MIFGVEGVCPERRRQLVQLLDIDLYQRLTTMSDGQRRRVQIAMGLLKPYDVSGLEEVACRGCWGARIFLGQQSGSRCRSGRCRSLFCLHMRAWQ